jgi:hypothetical protein
MMLPVGKVKALKKELPVPASSLAGEFIARNEHYILGWRIPLRAALSTPENSLGTVLHCL